MKSKLMRTGLIALALTLAAPVAMAPAQEINSIYVAPKLYYSYQKGDMASGNWNNGIWSTGAMGGNDTDSGFGVGLAVGADLGYFSEVPLRVELEYMYRSEAEFKDGPKTVYANWATPLTASQAFKVRAHSVMANAYFDINTQTDFTPYIGGGLGMAYLDTDYSAGIINGVNAAVNSSKGSWNFAWNVGLGVGFSVSENLTLDVGYRYVDLGKADAGSIAVAPGPNLGYSGSPSVDYTAHEVGVGLRFSGF